MPKLTYATQEVHSRANETVLDAFLRQGISLPFSCKGGTCHRCLSVCTEGQLPPAAQRGLSAAQKAQGHFLPCLCVPEGDLGFEPQAAAEARAARQMIPGEHPPGEEVQQQQPDPEMWAWLENGPKLMGILEDFYGRVFADAMLAPFFHATTKQRAIEKQYSFLRQVFSGEHVFFGEKPRNSHHWMVISHEVFDYRENIMLTCLRDHGMPDHLVERWRIMEGRYRPDIVKSAPWKRFLGDIEMPLEGFERLTMDVGSMCDACDGEIKPGDQVIYHVRTGATYCAHCSDTPENLR